MSRTRRRPTVLLLGFTALVTAGTAVHPAGAQGPRAVHQASSDGTVFALSVLGQGVTAGRAHSEASTEPSAAASGVGFDNPVAPVATSQASARAEGEAQGSTEPTCALPVPPDLPLLGLDVVCSSAVAAISGGRPTSTSTAEILGVDVNLLGTLADTPLSTVTETLGTGLDQLLEALSPVLGPIDENSGLGLQDTLGDLFGAVLGDTDLVNIEVGDTATTTGATDSQLVSSCRTEGATVTVLDPVPIGDVDPAPALQIVLGPVQTSVAIDLATGEMTPSAFPAAVRVTAPALGIDLPVGPGQSVEIPLPEPLGLSTVALAGPSTTTEADGTVVATAPAVALHLLTGSALAGGITLDLATCTSRGLAAAIPVPQPSDDLARSAPSQAPGTTPGPALADTGGAGSGPLLLAAAATVIAVGLRRILRVR